MEGRGHRRHRGIVVECMFDLHLPKRVAKMEQGFWGGGEWGVAAPPPTLPQKKGLIDAPQQLNRGQPPPPVSGGIPDPKFQKFQMAFLESKKKRVAGAETSHSLRCIHYKEKKKTIKIPQRNFGAFSG